MCPLSMTTTARVRRLYVASISRPASRASCTMRLADMEVGATMATMRPVRTMSPNPTLTVSIYHSKFCTCSRSFSTSFFIATTTC